MEQYYEMEASEKACANTETKAKENKEGDQSDDATAASADEALRKQITEELPEEIKGKYEKARLTHEFKK